MNNIIVNVDNSLNSILDQFVRKPIIIKGIVHLFLILYASRLAPVPPKQVLELFDNQYFKLACMVLILWTANFSPSTSILIAIAFMVSINYSTTGKVWEMLENVVVQQAASSQGPVQVPMEVQVSKDESKAALSTLVEAAKSSSAQEPAEVVKVANMVVANVKTEEGVKAVGDIAKQAVVAEAGAPEKMAKAEEVVKASMDSTGCFPVRTYDISKVMPQTDGVSTVEDYQVWAPM